MDRSCLARASWFSRLTLVASADTTMCNARAADVATGLSWLHGWDHGCHPSPLVSMQSCSHGTELEMQGASAIEDPPGRCPRGFKPQTVLRLAWTHRRSTIGHCRHSTPHPFCWRVRCTRSSGFSAAGAVASLFVAPSIARSTATLSPSQHRHAVCAATRLRQDAAAAFMSASGHNAGDPPPATSPSWQTPRGRCWRRVQTPSRCGTCRAASRPYTRSARTRGPSTAYGGTTTTRSSRRAATTAPSRCPSPRVRCCAGWTARSTSRCRSTRWPLPAHPATWRAAVTPAR